MVILRVNGYQALCLMQFNNAYSLYVKEIAEKIGISSKDCEDLMTSFVIGRYKILTFTNGGDKVGGNMKLG